MSTNGSEVADVDHDRLTDQVISLSARFPEMHEASDCIETVRLMVDLFGTILKVDGGSDSATADFDPRSPDLLPTYSLADADKISKKLRALARVRGTKPVLSTWENSSGAWPPNSGADGGGMYVPAARRDAQRSRH